MDGRSSDEGRPIIGRLAPSPTGAQHVGNARTYLLCWLAARSKGGRVILRIEDIDSPRVKAGADQQAIEDLRWLGLDWDEGPDVGGSNGPYVQSERMNHYQSLLDRLLAAERVFPCTCSRTDVAAAASAPHAEHEGPDYPGVCRHRRSADATALSDRPFAWRFRGGGQSPTFDDLVKGRCELPGGAVVDDFIVWKSNQTPAYQLAVVADDIAMNVTQVVRGDDLIPSTFRQLCLYEFLGQPPPVFAHVPLVIGADGRRLAKRHGDTRLSTLRAEGVSSDKLIGLLAWSCGLLLTPRPVTAKELLSDFDLASVSKHPFMFTRSILG